MRVGLYGREDVPAIAALQQGFRNLGHQAVVRRLSVFSPDQKEDFDLVVSYGKRGAGRLVIEAYRSTPVFVLDAAMLFYPEHPTSRSLHPRDLNRLTEADVDDSRMWLLPERVTVDVGGSRILLCAPTRKDAGHPFDGAGIESWLLMAADALREQGFDVIWRPHPNDPFSLADFQASDPTVPVEKVLGEGEWRGVATWASNVGWTALMAGLPVYASRSAPYAKLAQTDFSAPPKEPEWVECEELLKRLTWTVFLEEEMRRGLAPSFLVQQAESKERA